MERTEEFLIKDFMKTENFFIRKISKEDYSYCMLLCADEPSIETIYNVSPELVKAQYWSMLTKKSDVVHFLIFCKKDNAFYGKISLRYKTLKYPKISVIVLKKYRNKGVGCQVIKEWANVLYKESDVKRLDLNNDMGNVQGKKCFHKLGAILNSNYDEEYYRLELPIK